MNFEFKLTILENNFPRRDRWSCVLPELVVSQPPWRPELRRVEEKCKQVLSQPWAGHGDRRRRIGCSYFLSPCASRGCVGTRIVPMHYLIPEPAVDGCAGRKQQHMPSPPWPHTAHALAPMAPHSPGARPHGPT